MKFVEKVTKALIKQQNFSNYYNKTDKIRSKGDRSKYTIKSTIGKSKNPAPITTLK